MKYKDRTNDGFKEVCSRCGNDSFYIRQLLGVSNWDKNGIQHFEHIVCTKCGSIDHRHEDIPKGQGNWNKI